MPTVEELQQKLKDAVKQYEGKLAAISALNSALQKENEQLRDELDEATQPKTHSEAEALELKQEFARRLGEQQRHIDVLKDTNQKLQAKIRDATAGSSATEAQLTTLQDKLTKQQHDNAQLAAKASELEKGARKLNHRIKELENERDKHASRAQVADIQLTEAKEALAAAGQAANLKLQYLQQEHQQALAAAKQQHAESIADLERQLAAAKQAAAAGSEREAAVAAEREAAMAAALADARAAVQAQQEQHAELEQRHRKALQRYQAQIRQLETEKLELLSDSGDAGTSLLRQIQSLAAQASAAQASAADQEQLLLGKLRMAEKVAAEAAAAERDAAGRAASAEAALVATKEAAAAAVQECAALRSRLEAAQRHGRTLEAERNGAQDRLAAAQSREQALQQELQQQQRQSQEQLWEATQRIQQLSRQQDELHHKLEKLQQLYAASTERSSSTAAAAVADGGNLSGSRGQSRRSSFGALQLAGPSCVSVDDVGTAAVAGAPSNSQQSLASMGSLQQQPLQGSNGSLLPALSIFRADSAGSSQQSGRQQSLFSPGGKLSAEAVQQLQRAVFQLQQELAAAVQERDAAQEQLYQALRQADEAAAALQKADKLRQELQELEGKLEVAMEIIGERSLRIEELEADIVDMKEIFHTQLEVAVSQLQALKQQQQEQQQQQKHPGEIDGEQ